MKRTYQKPATTLVEIDIEELLQNLPGASNIQNGDDEEPTPVTPGDPSGGIGAKHNNMWDAWDEEGNDW